jgi:hypothetical protein
MLFRYESISSAVSPTIVEVSTSVISCLFK